jgi:C-terminal processing protease CtpA/Prc
MGKQGELQKLMLQDLSGGQAVELFRGYYLRAPRWAPDGSQIILSARTEEGVSAPTILMIPRLGQSFRRIAEGVYGSGGYFSSFLIVEGKQSPGDPGAPEKPVILLVDRATALTGDLLSLQASGAGAIVAEGGLNEEEIVPQTRVELVDGLAAAVRTGEIVYPDGTAGIAPDRTVPSNGMGAALELARTSAFPIPARNPVPATGSFAPDNAYPETPYPSEAHRAPAAVRIWSIFHYFHPYKHLYGEDWDSLLPRFLVKMMKAANALEYHKTVAEMVAHIHDTHCFVSSPVLREFYGPAPPPLTVRWIEQIVVIDRISEFEEMQAAHLSQGDIVLKVDGHDVKERMDELAAHVAASTPQALHWRILNTLLNGAEGSPVTVTVKDGGGRVRDVSLPRSGRFAAALGRPAGDPIRLINENIGYVDLSRLPPERVDEMFEKFANTRAFIMDMRGYPQGTAWQIAPRLSAQDQPVAAQFRRNLVTADNISSYYFEQKIPPATGWHYSGKTVMRIDERTISQAEHSGLFYRTANQTKFVGSATNGANGDVPWFWAPGGIRINFSGHDVRHADGTQLQRVGLPPDIEVIPTIAGIRAGRDEVLEKAVEYLTKNP